MKEQRSSERYFSRAQATLAWALETNDTRLAKAFMELSEHYAAQAKEADPAGSRRVAKIVSFDCGVRRCGLLAAPDTLDMTTRRPIAAWKLI